MTSAEPRAARWSRVSSAKQATSDREGLPYQRDLQDRAINALDALDSGTGWVVAHSGGTVHETSEWTDMLSQAGRTFDVLVVAYTSRLGRNAEEQLRAVRLIGEAGAAVYFAEERVLTSDETAWEGVAREIVESEAYRRRLSRTMRRTYESRWRRRGLPAGVPPYGYRPDWTIDEDKAQVVRDIFSGYASRRRSLRELAIDHELAEEHVKVIIRNPAYTGLAQRHGEFVEGQMPAIIDRDTWNRVIELRSERRFTSGPRSMRPSILQGMRCTCNARLRLNGRDGGGATRLRHLHPCIAWGKHEHRRSAHLEQAIKAAICDLRPTDKTLAEHVARHTAAPPAPITRLDTRRHRQDIAQALVDGHLTAEEAQWLLDSPGEPIPAPATPTASVWDARAIATYFGRLGDALALLEPDLSGVAFTDERSREAFAAELAAHDTSHDQLWADLARRIFARLEYHGDTDIRYRLTDEAQQYFVNEVMPTQVTIGGKVGGEGLEPPTPSV
jgi:DNA invertase Pin-like site-specific DNA recombinase